MGVAFPAKKKTLLSHNQTYFYQEVHNPQSSADADLHSESNKFIIAKPLKNWENTILIFLCTTVLK